MASKGLNGSLCYRYLADRPANGDNLIVAERYFVIDAQVNFTQPKYNIGLSIHNLIDTRWQESQFATESRLQNEAEPVEEIHFPRDPVSGETKLHFFLLSRRSN